MYNVHGIIGNKYIGNIMKNLARGFWKNATDKEKIEGYKILFNHRVIKTDSCWGWKSFINSTGCGMIGAHNHLISAYRASWLIHKGAIPKNLLVLHKCNNRICTNPEHLYLGTAKENARDHVNSGKGNFNKQNSKNAKLNIDKVKKIKELLKIGKTQQSIANLFNVSRGTIQDIHRKYSWRNI